ncbi:MAG: helix-turn-helix transcriptional regulator [Brachyspira sp.]|nr:helix-turn-helix transcriptional regulator [Brachyspira sp.]
MKLKSNIGKRIKEIRKKKGLSQEKLAELVDIEQNTLSCIETGNNFCTAETLEKIINTLEVEPAELFNFGHQKDNETLLIEINSMLNKTPDKIPEVYKIIKAIIH